MSFIPASVDDNGVQWQYLPTVEERARKIRTEAPIHLTRDLSDEELLAEQVQVSDEQLRLIFGRNSDSRIATKFGREHRFQYRILKHGRAVQAGLVGPFFPKRTS